ncbi:unnamed protein product [Urochloa humidicola]
MSQSQTNSEVDKMLDVYIYDYFVKRNLQATAKAFQAEGKVSSDPVAIDAPGGFLFEWWSVFWDIFIARTNEKHSDVAASYIEASKKRKKPVSSSGRANSSGTANTAGTSPSSAPSTPSTHTPGDAMSMPQLQYNGGPSKPLMMFSSDGTGSLTSPANPLGDVDRLLENGSLDENVESFLSQDDMDP